ATPGSSVLAAVSQVARSATTTSPSTDGKYRVVATIFPVMTVSSACSGTMPLGPAARAIAGEATTGTSSPSSVSCGRMIASAALLTTKRSTAPSLVTPFVPNQLLNCG